MKHALLTNSNNVAVFPVQLRVVEILLPPTANNAREAGRVGHCSSNRGRRLKRGESTREESSGRKDWTVCRTYDYESKFDPCVLD